MKPNEYLKEILARQTFEDDAPELKEIRKHRKGIEAKLRNHFSKSSPSIRWAGSMAKGTMIRESYDGDMTCYFPDDEKEAGTTLEELYENTAAALAGGYVVERKASVLRVRDPATKATKGFAEDLHIDVVPGRFTDGDAEDVFLHQSTGGKERLKTNLQVHVDHIKNSGVVDAIRLVKLWNVRNGVGAKTFVLELLVVKLLENKKAAFLSTQLEHVWTEFRDDAESLSVEDPANPVGNDLKPSLDQVRYGLSSVASTTLSAIQNKGWDAVFGDVEEYNEENGNRVGLKAAAGHVSNPTKPWCSGV